MKYSFLSTLLLICCAFNISAQQIYYSKKPLIQTDYYDIYISDPTDPCTPDSIIDIAEIGLRHFCHAVQSSTGDIFIKHTNANQDSIYISQLSDNGTLIPLNQTAYGDLIENISFISPNELLIPGATQYFVYNTESGDLLPIDLPDLWIIDFWFCGEQTYFIDSQGDIFEYFDGDFSNRNYIENINLTEIQSFDAINIDCFGRCPSD